MIGFCFTFERRRRERSERLRRGSFSGIWMRRWGIWRIGRVERMVWREKLRVKMKRVSECRSECIDKARQSHVWR